MALVLADRVRETTTVVGTGTATLLGAVTGYQSFTAVGNANTTYYVIASQAANEWEVGIGTYTASGTTLSRDTVLSSSNAGALVNFGAGTKDVWGDYPAGRAVTTDTLAYPPVIGNTTPNAATFTTLTATGQTSLGGAAGAESFRATSVASAVNWVQAAGAITSGAPLLSSQGADTNIAIGVTSKGTSAINFLTNNGNQRQAQITHTASAVNFVQVTGAATGGSPTISTLGSDTTQSLTLQGRGSAGSVILGTGFGTYFRAVGAAGATVVNNFQAQGAATTLAPVLSAQGADTNIAAVFQSKGTGAINLAAGSSGVNISNGGTVTAITRTAAGGSYTSIPAIAISAPTTAGGVQATATANLSALATSITSGGTGYTVGDVLTFVGGTASVVITATVTTVSSGVITAVTYSSGGAYSVIPSNPISVTGGTGSGATFTVTSWGVSSPFTITNAGSGYVEQPTVTFSGGGGSGAAAYATVGSGSVIRSLGQTGTSSLSFFTPSGEVLRLRDTGSTGTYVMVNTTASGANLVAQGATNASFGFNSNGTSAIQFGTNGNTGNTQMQVAHTASAVNFVQVTGAATGLGPTISTQGSDANVGMAFRSKGSGFISFGQDSTNQFEIIRTASAVNRLRVTGSTAGNAPIMASEGTDTNIDLALTPKGTGLVRFGTRTASADAAITGYIEIRDSGGTIRRLAVIG